MKRKGAPEVRPQTLSEVLRRFQEHMHFHNMQQSMSLAHVGPDSSFLKKGQQFFFFFFPKDNSKTRIWIRERTWVQLQLYTYLDLHL